MPTETAPFTEYADVADAASSLNELRIQRAAQNSAKKQGDKLADLLRAFHEAHPDDELVDNEHGLRATFNTPGSRWVKLDEWPDDLLLWATERGMISFTMGTYDKLKEALPGDEMDRIAKLIYTGAGTTRVSVEKLT